MAYKDWLSSLGDEGVRLLNLSRKDLTDLPSERLIDIIAWQQSGIEILDDKLQKAEVEVAQMQEAIDRFSINPNTGVFTSGALAMLNEVLIGSRILEYLKLQGFTLKMCLLDVDEMQTHNSLGGREAGDIVLAEVAKRLKMLYRRRSDIVAHGLVDFLSDIRGVLRKFEKTRLDKGDEMIAWRFAAPIKNDMQRGNWQASKEVARIKQGFEEAVVSYPILQSLTPDDIKKLDPQGRFKVRSGIVTAPISVTFACVYAPLPISKGEIRRVVRKADEMVLITKNRRKAKPPKGSQGEAVTLAEDDLI